MRVRTIIVTGVFGDGCVLATICGGFSRGYHFWMLVIFFPRRSITQRIMKSVLPIVLPAAVHTAFIAMLLKSRPDLKDDYSATFPLTSSRVLAKMTEPDMATVSWLHMLPADLFLGRWMYFDSRKRNLSPWLVSPTLAVTSTSDSVGFILYLMVRTLHALSSRPANPCGAEGIRNLEADRWGQV